MTRSCSLLQQCLPHTPLIGSTIAQEAKTVDRSAAPEERLTEEEAAEVESGTGRKVEKKDAEGKIYIGFDKNDPTPRAGRKGRMIDDDEERYPSRSEMAGGWAGGEKGLRAFVEVTSLCLPSLLMQLTYFAKRCTDRATLFLC